MKALTAAEMREVDVLTTTKFGIPSQQLMETAGKSVADLLLEQYAYKSAKPPGRVCVLSGKGNNGGDGFVAARYLKEEAEQVEVYLFGAAKELEGDAARNYRRWKEEGGKVHAVETPEQWEKARSEALGAEVIVDALLGTGIRGTVRGVAGQAIEELNGVSRKATAALPARIVAVDMPSGLPSDGEAAAGPVVRAHLTVTFTAPKVGQLISDDAPSCGQLYVRSIGSPAELVEKVGKGTLRWAGAEEFAGLALVRAADAHKGSYGHILLVAGSVGKTGAAVMAGASALRGGAGLVTIATPEPALRVVAATHPEYMTEGLGTTTSGTIAAENLRTGRVEEILRGKTVLALGPGIGVHEETTVFIREMVRQTDLPIVLDADGLNAFAGQASLLREKRTKYLAVTPHPGEMARLLGSSTAEVQKARVKTAVDAAKQWEAHVILKGFHTVLASPSGEVFVNTSGNAALAKGGSGDVLTGLLAALIGQFGTAEFLRVLALGVYLHGRAAELLSEPTDASGILASEVAHAIPFARRKLLEELRARE